MPSYAFSIISDVVGYCEVTLLLSATSDAKRISEIASNVLEVESCDIELDEFELVKYCISSSLLVDVSQFFAESTLP